MSNVIEWVEKSAKKFGNKDAFLYEDERISFVELRDCSRRIGATLNRLLDDKRPVAVIMPKGIKTICAYLGIVYSGRIYAPIDSSMPRVRIQQVLSTLVPSAIITTHETEKAIDFVSNDSCTKQLFFDELDSDEGECEAANILSTDPLYIIFTSGSTGVPKGVVTSHLALMTYIESYSKMMNMNETDVIANQSPLDYVAAIRDIYIPLYSGCATVILEKKLFLQPDILFEQMDERGVTCASWNASSLTVLSKLHAFEDGVIPRKLRKLCFSGAVPSADTIRKWQSALPKVFFVNQYGPTEATASCTYYVVDHLVSPDEMIPIGVPYDNYRILIVDEHGNEVPNGTEGEICVLGPAIALGYYHNDCQTRDRFVQNPLNCSYPETMYKTGDYGLVDDKGILWFRGRIDRQIKIMGHRVELDGIEAVCASIDGVKESACFYDCNKEQLHLLYSGIVGKKDLIKRLRDELPLYMVPRIVNVIDEIPKLPNGKVDYKSIAEA